MGAQNLNHWPTREVPSLSFCTGVGQGDSPKPSTNLPGNLGAHSLGQGLGFPLCEMSRRWSQRPCWLGLSLSDSFIPRAPFPALMTGGWEGTTLPAPRALRTYLSPRDFPQQACCHGGSELNSQSCWPPTAPLAWGKG